MAKVCRICLEEYKDMISIYNKENMFQKTIVEMIDICMAVKVDEHKLLPILVCRICVDEIIQATKLRLKFNKSHLFLIEHLLSLKTNDVEKDQIIIIDTIKEDDQKLSEDFYHNDIFIDNKVEIISEGVHNDTNRQALATVANESTLNINKVETMDISGDLKKMHQCKFCGEMFNSKKEKLQHQRDFSHYLKKTILCAMCNLQVPVYTYKTHCLTHSIKFKCDICGKELYNNYNLQRHIRTHTKQTPYSCELCNSKFARQDQLKEHKLLHSSGNVICKFCKTHFENQADLQKHFHEDSNCNSDQYQRPLSCDVCSRKFTLLSSLNTHKLSHTNESVLCGYCGNPYPNKKKLQSHISQVHQKQESKQFLCNICAKQYSSKLILDRHLLSHTGIAKKYVCKVCKKGFSQSSSLILHKVVHTGDKPYVCHICSAAFNKSCNLSRHLAIHSDVLLHECSICDKSFRTKQSLTIHTRIHTGEKPFSCFKCDKKFSDPSSLSKHSKLHETDSSTTK